MIKVIFMLFMLFFSHFVKAEREDLLSISLDKQYYFNDVLEKEIDINVVNNGTGLAYIDVQMFAGELVFNKNGNDKLKFNAEQRLLKYDIYPSTVLVPPKQERLIKLVRTDEHDFKSKEEFYRIRVIPVSPVELLKKNPALWEKLNVTQQAELQHELNNAKGVFNLSIGSGSILTVQPRNNIKFDNISLSSDASGFSLKNTGIFTIELSSLVMYSAQNEPHYFDNVILKPNDIKRLRSTGLKKIKSNFVPSRINYINQYGEKISVKL